MNFFKYFPTVDYVFQNSNGHYALTLTNITAHVRIVERLKKHISVFYTYAIQDEERPDTVSVRLYGTPNYTWLVLLINNIFSLFDWPLTTDEFDRFIIERYGSVETALTTFIYKTSAGFRVDFDTWSALDGDLRSDPITNYDNELELNEQKRNIRVVPAEFINSIAAEFKKALAS